MTQPATDGFRPRDSALRLDAYIGRTHPSVEWSHRWRWDVTAWRHGEHMIAEAGYTRFYLVALFRVGRAVRQLDARWGSVLGIGEQA